MFKRINRKIEELEQDKITEQFFNQTIQSYLGILKHCSGYKIEEEIKRKLSSLKRI